MLGKKDKVIKHCNSFIILGGFIGLQKRNKSNRYTHDVAWHCCAILIVMISAKESILNVHSKIVQEVLKYKGNSSLHFVLYNMIQNVGNC